MDNGLAAIVTVSDLKTGIYIFQLKVTDNAGATSTTTIRVTVENQQVAAAYLNIYPNPASGVLTMKYTDNANGKFRITIYDANSRLVRDELIDKTQTTITKTIDVSLLGAGVYFIKVISPDNGKVVKLFARM